MMVLPNLPSCKERFCEPEKEITSDSEIPNAMRIIPVMTASFHQFNHAGFSFCCVITIITVKLMGLLYVPDQAWEALMVLHLG